MILDSWLSDCDLAIPLHCHRESVEQEFEIVLKQSLDSVERITEQFDHYRMFHPACLSEKPLWTGIIVRNNTVEVQEWSKMWWRHVLRYSRRDQLSVSVACDITRPRIHRVNIDNFLSEFHHWPVINERNSSLRTSPIARGYHEIREGGQRRKGTGFFSETKWLIKKLRNRIKRNTKDGN